jgi:hypothetical protein
VFYRVKRYPKQIATKTLRLVRKVLPRIKLPGRPSPPFRHRVAGSALQATASISTCWAAWTKTSRRQPRFWRYDPATNTYNTSLPSYTIPTYFHASAYLNGKIYRIAGAAIGTDFHVEVYDIATNSWSMAANYPFANHNLMAAALGNYIYAGGGNASRDKTYRYDPNTDTWDDASIAELPAGRSSAASGAYNGRWLLAGGDVNFAISNSVIAWDPATNTWSNLPIMVQARDNLEGATAGQSFYAVAGDSGPGTPTNDNQQYTETCTTPTPTPSPTPTPTVTPTATPTPTSTPRVTPTPRVAPTSRPRPTPPPRPAV